MSVCKTDKTGCTGCNIDGDCQGRVAGTFCNTGACQACQVPQHCGNPGCTVTSCSCSVPNAYWSSSTYALGPQGAWSVSFDVGGTVALVKNFSTYIRAVRGGS